MFSNGFVWDDLVFIRDNGAIRGLWPPARFLDAPPGMGQRPLLMLSYALDFRLYGLQPWGYHLTNLLLHLLCVLGVVFLGKALFKNCPVALFAGALFAVHPGHAEAVISFLGRSDLLATAFLLWGFLGYLRSSEFQGSSAQLLLSSSVLSFALACLVKDTAVVFLALIILWDLAQGNHSPEKRRTTVLRWFSFLAVLVFYGVFRGLMAGGMEDKVRWWGGSPWKTTLLVFAAYGEYLRLAIVPTWLSPWYEVDQLSALSLKIGLGMALALLTVLGLRLLFRRPTPGFFLLGWFALGLSPVLLSWLFIGLGPGVWGVLPGTLMAERWFYPSSAAACLAGAWGWFYLWGKSRFILRWALMGLLAVLLLLFGIRSYTWTLVWKDQKTLGQTILSRFPRSYLGHLALGTGLMEEGRFEDGVKHYDEAVALRPDLAWIRYNYAVALRDIGRYPEAVEHYRTALALQPMNSLAHNNLGTILYEQGRTAEAEAEYREAIRCDPNHIKARVNLGNVLDDLGRPAEAEAEYREVIRLAPDFAGAHYNLGVLLMHQGRKLEAVEAFQAFLAHGGEPRAEVEDLIRNLRGW